MIPRRSQGCRLHLARASRDPWGATAYSVMLIDGEPSVREPIALMIQATRDRCACWHDVISILRGRYERTGPDPDRPDQPFRHPADSTTSRPAPRSTSILDTGHTEIRRITLLAPSEHPVRPDHRLDPSKSKHTHDDVLRAVAILCFLVVMLITALTAARLETPAATVRGGRMTETVAAPRVPPQGGTAALRRP